MIFAIADGEQIWKAWEADEITDRKINNFMKKIQREQNNTAKFIINI